MIYRNSGQSLEVNTELGLLCPYVQWSPGPCAFTALKCAYLDSPEGPDRLNRARALMKERGWTGKGVEPLEA